jgi:hypothetical protein
VRDIEATKGEGDWVGSPGCRYRSLRVLGKGGKESGEWCAILMCEGVPYET